MGRAIPLTQLIAMGAKASNPVMAVLRRFL
jgi:hypothetical protein